MISPKIIDNKLIKRLLKLQFHDNSHKITANIFPQLKTQIVTLFPVTKKKELNRLMSLSHYYPNDQI